MLAAHRSQLHAVPEGYSDEQAMLIEPMACAVHTALRGRGRRQRPGARQRGRLGRAARHARAAQLTAAGEITVVAKHAHQRELAPAARRHRGRRARARRCGGSAARPAPSSSTPEFSAPYLLGGVDVAVDAVGSSGSLETALHATRAGGRVVLSGMPAAADLSAAWFRELEVVGTYASAQREPRGGRPQRLRHRDRAGRRATPWPSWPRPWPAIRCTAGARRSTTPTRAGRLGTVKVAFDPRSTQE